MQFVTTFEISSFLNNFLMLLSNINFIIKALYIYCSRVFKIEGKINEKNIMTPLPIMTAVNILVYVILAFQIFIYI